MPKAALLSFEEILQVTEAFAKEGISKIRITGGEPFLRKDMMLLLAKMSQVEGIKEIHITTNGTLLEGKVGQLKELGIKSVNLSLDSLDPERFKQITRRDDLPKVMACMQDLTAHDIEVKINMVVMKGKNEQDILPMLELAKDQPVAVRFIEEMPFNGTEGQGNQGFWSHADILAAIQEKYALTRKLKDAAGSTSMNYSIDGFAGSFGIIAAYSRTFCGTCNRIRLTPQGLIKTCLYDNGIFNVRDMLRAGASQEAIVQALKAALNHRFKDGHAAEAHRKSQFPIFESMATIGG